MEAVYQPDMNLLICRFKKMSLLGFILMAIMVMCNTTLSSQCSNPVTSFPISDDFEISIGNWNQDATDDFDWTRNTGTTGSSGTGPTTGNGGSLWYMYTESSSPNHAGQIANLISPCIAVAGATNIDFAYHMYSTTTMGTLNVDVRINGAGVWTNIWTRTGNQGDIWKNESLNLDAYAGQNIEIRLSVITDTFRSDIGIDDLLITQTVEICDNGIDDDGDGLIDCDDPECADPVMGDYVWNDINGDGIQNEDMAIYGINNVTVELYVGTCSSIGSSATPVATTLTTNHPVTGNPGWYSLEATSGNDYCIALSKYNYYSGGTLVGKIASPMNQGGDDQLDSDGSNSYKIDINSTICDDSKDFGLHQVSPIQEGVCYIVADAGDYFAVIDTTDGHANIIGKINPPDGENLTIDPEDFTVFNVAGENSATPLISINDQNATTSIINADLGLGDVDGLAFNPFNGQMYAVKGDPIPGILYRIDKTNGDTIRVVNFNLPIPDPLAGSNDRHIDGISFHPETGVLYGTYSYWGTKSYLVTIDTLTGDLTMVGGVGGDPGYMGVDDAEDLSFAPNGVLFGVLGDQGAFGTDPGGSFEGLIKIDLVSAAPTPVGLFGNALKGSSWDVEAFACSVPLVIPDEICDNGIDDDGDGLIDGADPDCESHWFEAECGIVGANWDIVSDATASNDKYMTIQTGNTSNTTAPTGSDDRIRFNVTISNPGDYKVFGRVKGATSDDDSFWVRVNEGTWYKWNSITQFAPTSFEWGQVWDSDNAKALLSFALSAGSNTIDFAYREDGAQLDKIMVGLSDITPSGEGDPANNCVEICDNNIDDDGDGNIDCLDGDCGGNSTCVSCNLLSNTEFNYGTTTWVIENSSTATSTLSADDSGQLSGYYSAFIDISTSTGTGWHTQLNSGPYSIDISKTYNVSFEAKATSSKVINAVIQQGVSPSTIYYSSPNFNITTTAQTYTISNFSVSATSSEAIFKIYLGSDVDDIWIDNIVFEEVNCTPPQLNNEVCYFISDGDASGAETQDTFYTFNYETSAVTPIGPTGTYKVESMAMDTVNNIVYATDGDKFGFINIATGKFIQISSDVAGSLNGADGILDIDDIDGMTYDHANNIIWATERRTMSGNIDGAPDDLLLKINPNTGLADQNGFGSGIGYVVVPTPENDLDDIAIAEDGTLYAISNFGGSGNQAFGIIDKTNGAWTEIGDYGIEDVESLAFTATGQLVATTGKDGHDSNQLYTIDAGTGLATYIGSVLPGHDVEACDCMSGQFKNLQIGDKVFADLDSDGIQDLEEPGVPNVTVNLLTNSGSPYLNSIGAPTTTVTDAFGIYNFNGLGGGQYIVEFILPGGGESFTTANAGGDDELDSDANLSTGRTPIITLSGSTNNLSLDAGLLNANVVVRDCTNDGELLVIDGGGTIKRFDQNTGALIGDFIQGLNGPIEMLVGPDDWLYVSNRIEDEVRKYSLKTGVLIETITGDLRDPHGMTIGPDGNIYVNNDDYDEVIKIDVATGVTSKFTISAAGGLDGNKWGIEFGPDGNLYVASFYTDEVLRYNGTTGAFIDVFVAANSANINAPSDITFGPDGHLYVAGKYNDKVCKYNGTTGAFMSTFVSYQLGGLQDPVHLQFGDDGFLYVSSQSGSIGVLKYNGTTGGIVGNFAYTAAPEGILFAPVPGCINCDITSTTSVSSCIDHPLRDVAELTVTIDWTSVPSGGNLVIETGNQSRIVDGNLSSPQSVDFMVTADGTANIGVKVYWDNQVNCEYIATYDSPSACSTEELSCDILYLCGLDKPYDGDAWDHGWLEYIDDINGSAVLTPILTKDEAGMGTYNPMSQSTFVNVNLNDYDIIIISATTENHISADLVNQLKNASASILLSNYTLLSDLGMSSTAGVYTWDDEAYTDTSTKELIYNYNNPNATSGNIFTHGDYGNGANAFLWATTGANTDGILYSNSADDALPGIVSTHGDRVYVGYHFNGVYANSENNGSLPSPVSAWFVPETHLTLKGKELFDKALLYAGNGCVDEICDDGKDNDGDGLIDCLDPECNENIAVVSDDQVICEGENAILIASGGGTYLWDNGLGNGAAHSVSPTTTTVYQVTVTSTAGCTEVAATTVTVSPDLSVSIDFNGSQCLENDSQITAVALGGTAPLTYSWTGPNTFTSSNATIAIAQSGNYYITVTDALGCEASTSGFIYAAFEPFIFSLETSVCEGESVDLEINGSNITAYAWDANAGSDTTSSVTVTPSAPSSTYVVTVTNTNGCTSTASATIGAEALPIANAGGDVSICNDESILMSTTDVGGGTTYDWNFGANASPTTASGAGPHSVSYTNPNANGANHNNTVNLTVTKGDCTNSDTKNVLILAIPNSTVTTSSPSCGVDDGSITFSFDDNPSRTIVKFSIDGGNSFPYSANDNVGSITISNLPSGDYDLYTVWDNGECPQDLDSITFANNTIPTINITGNDTICKGSTTLVSASTTGTWTSSDEFVATVSSSGIVLGVGEGVANITFIADNNCAATTSIQITVTNKEGVIITGEDILCSGTTTTLTASKGGGVWESDNNSVATIIDTTGVVTAVSAGTVLMSYVHGSNSCNENSSFSIEIFNTPTASITGSAEVCEGETTTLSTDGIGGYWTSSDNNIAAVSTSGLVTGISAGDVTFFYTNGDDCPSPITGIVTVNPAVSVTIDFNGSVCLTEDSQLSAIATGGTTGYAYAWTGPGGFTGNTQTIDISIDGNYYVTVTDSKGCTDMRSAFVYESYEPFIFTLNTTVCEGESVTLSISGASATSYQWSASAGNATTQSVTVVPTVPSTSYVVTVTNSVGCTTEATADIAVDAKPIVNITGSTDICVGENTQLSPTTGGIWTSANSSVASVTDEGLVTGMGNGSTTFTFKNNATGCVSDPTGIINIGTNGTVSISGSNQICFSENPTMTASVTGGSWNSTNPGVATIDTNGVVTPQAQGNTTITYNLPEGDCFSDGNYGITIHNDPTLSLNGPSTICEGENTYVSASTSGSWSSSDVSIATINSTGVITAVSAGNATISFISNFGCTAVLGTPITVIDNPEVIRLGPAEICINNTTNLSPTTGGIWISSNNNVASVSSNGTVTGNAPGTATFSFIESTNGCLSDETITITVYGIPSINGLSSSELCIGETASITPSAGGTWISTNDAVATIENNGVITAVGAGSARFIFTSNATGCSSAQSAPLSVNGNPSINFTGLTSICKGELSSISPASGGQWSSTDVTVAMISQNGTITGVNPGTVTFIYTSNLTGCSSDPSTPLTVEEPTEITLTGPSEICVNETTSMMPNSGGTWNSSNVNIATISSNGVIVGQGQGIVTFTFDSNTDCTSDPSIEITVLANPVVGFSGPSEICIGTTTNLSPNSGGTWTSSNTSIATVDDTGLVTAIGFGSAQFTFENTSTGCQSTTNGSLSVYLKPVAEIIGDDEICEGFNTYLTPSSGGTWTSSNTNVAIISSSGQVTGVSPGTATFTFYENGSNCVSDASAPVTVLQKAPVSIDGDNTICVGETTTVLPNTGGSWTSNNPGVATVTDAGIVTGVTQGIAKFTYISNSGCESNETSPVIVYGSPSVSTSGPSQICINEQTQMLPSSGGTWTSNSPLIATIEDNGLVTAVASGIANFTFTDGGTGCISDPSDDITVSETPTTGLNGPSDICIGSISFLTPSTGGIWTALDPGIATIQNNGQVTGVASGNARFVFTKLNTGCESEINNDITVNSGPAINFTGPTEICEGDTTNITSANPGTWESTNTLIATITNDGLITGISAGAVKFKFTETSTGCISDVSETLIVNGPPTVSVAGSSLVCIGSTSSLSPSNGGTWESLTLSIATVTVDGIITGIAEGTAFFMFTDSLTGCKTDGSLSVDVASDVGAQITGNSEICAGYTTTLSPISGGVWTSSNPAVATVSNFGLVTGKAPGIVTFTFVDSGSGCSAGGTTDPVTVGKCLTHDFNVALVDQDIIGNISTNDNFSGAVTYSNNKVTVEKPLASLTQLTINADGTYSFVTNKPGKYLYKIPVCMPPMTSGCPSAFLEINVIDNVYGQSNPLSNLEFATTYANSDITLPGNTITVNPLSNDDCVYTVGCNLDPSTLSIIDSPQNGSVVLSGTGSFDYTPNAGFIGHDTILYEVCEIGTNCSQSRQIITVNAPNALNSIVAADDFAYTLKGMAKSGNVADNDLDPENDEMTVTQQGSMMSPITVAEGSYYINNDGSYEFTPNVTYSGALEIIYSVCDNNATVACTEATLHIQVFDDLTLKIRVYLEGSLMQNGNNISIDGRPLMRDGLRVSPFTGENYIPVKDPYTYGNELFDDTPSKFVKMGPGLMAENLEIIDSLAVFSVSGDDAIVDWVHVELRDKNDNTVTIATRSGLLQRDGDIVDLDGTSLLRFQGINIDSFYICVRHRTHLGVMSEKVINGKFVDFTLATTPTFNFGTSLANGMDYTGLSQKSTVKSGYLALWAGDFNSDGQLKFTEPASDINILYGNVLFSSPQYLINYDFALDYFRGDYNMDGKAKYANPNDDRNYLQGQIIFHPLNINFISNLDGVMQQIP